MIFQDFIQQYQGRKVIILLEGKRKVLPEDESKLVAIAQKLTINLPMATFRSGNASGADELFSKGVASVNINQLQIIKPYAKHRVNKQYDSISISLDQLTISDGDEIINQTKIASFKSSKMVDRYLASDRTGLSIKASYLIRDTVKVMGHGLIPPINIALFYDDLIKPFSGGTGHTIRVCIENNVPFYNQTVWLNWL